MEKSPPPGTTSYSHFLVRSDVERRLSTLCASGVLATLHRALSDAQLYLVGGLVRDAFTGGSESDLDVATNIAPEEVSARCTKAGLRVVETGIQHGTVLVVVEETHIEVTTFREPCSRTVHEAARDIATDLSGRDFTINAIAFDVVAHTLVDPFNGIEDLYTKRLCAVGSASDRFIEDSLRILRMVRFGPAMGRSIEAETHRAASERIALLSAVSPERIKSELDKILTAEHAGDAFRALHLLGALPYTVPEIIPAIGFEQNAFHIHDVFEHTMSVIDRAPRDRILRWVALFHDTGKPHTLSVDESGNRHFYLHEMVSERLARERMRALKFSNDDIETIALLVRQHMRPLSCGAPGVRRILRDLGSHIDQWRQFKQADASPTRPDEEFEADATRFDEMRAAEAARAIGPSYGKLAIGGDDLVALGMKPGPAIGKILKELIEIVLDDPEKNTRETLLEEARRRIA